MLVFVYTRYFCCILKRFEFFDRFSKNTQISNFMTIDPVGIDFFHAAERTDGRTERNDETDSLFFAILHTQLKISYYLI
jgi:hypothetical protein